MPHAQTPSFKFLINFFFSTFPVSKLLTCLKGAEESFANKEQILLRSYSRANLRHRWSKQLKALLVRHGHRRDIIPPDRAFQELDEGGNCWSDAVPTLPLVAIVGVLLNLGILSPAAWGQTARLGIVRSLDNQGHWSGISQRMQASGIDYCIVDFAQVEQASDLGDVPVLFLPNIELLKPAQLIALQEWMERGGRLVVSGPTGTLSQPAVRDRLRSLVGAYWGFALTQPSTLDPLRTNTQTWVRQDGLRGNIRGGVVIPAGLNSSTAAVWGQDDSPPAVVTTEQSIFLGWRWGIDEASPADVDAAWLRAALGRYNLAPTGQAAKASPEYCVPSQAPTVAEGTNPDPSDEAIAPPTGADRAPDFPIPPPRVAPESREQITAVQATAMTQELADLIGRFESTLLTASALNSDVELATGEAVEQFLLAKGEEAQPEGTSLAGDRVVAQARRGLQNFQDALARKDYREARQQWLQARRLLWDNYPTEQRLAQAEIRAIWLDRGTIVNLKSERELAQLFDRLAAAGFNTVFFETVNASYPIYPSDVAPEQNPLVRGWDPLEAAVKLAHDRGMELHAWVWIFAAANQRHNEILNQPTDYTGPVLSRHPDWAVTDKRGRLFGQNTRKAFLDPANPEVRRYLLALLEEIASRYDVDGIQFDYIRYPFQDPRANQTFGYGQASRQQFKELNGIDPIKVYPGNRQMWQKWTEFRIQQIDSFVATASERLRSQRPDLILSAAVFPLPRQERLQRLQQNWENWAIRGDIDLMVPMTYALDTDGLQSLAQPILTQPSLSSSLILPGIRLLNLPDIVAIDQIQLLRDLSATGYALFAVENLNGNLRRIFQRTQGNGEPSLDEPLPYRQPLQTAAVRYQALQQEWSFLLANNQLSLPEAVLSEWGEQADLLSESLDRLAADPSRRNLLLAKSILTSFRTQFQQWMEEQAATQPYQIQVWDNRLATIERLLSYGERTARDD